MGVTEKITIGYLFDKNKESFDNWVKDEIKTNITGGKEKTIEELDDFDREDLEDKIELLRGLEIGEVVYEEGDIKVYFPRWGEYALVIKGDYDIIALFSEYEPMNPFLFDGVVVMPGHDSITLFSLRTRELKRKYIR